jgi:two-component system OmpR family response regulator/two-component system response regulator CpxR
MMSAGESNMAANQILLVDDDIELCELLAEYLRHEGFALEAAHDAESALARLAQGEPDLLVLDIMMPDQSGLELLQQLRPRYKLPVIMLTGRGDAIDRIVGLEMGADDYLAKPCNPRELLARIRAVLRRSRSGGAPGGMPQRVLSLHGISLDPGLREVCVNGRLLELTGTEFNLLALLMQNAGQVMSKELLTERVLHRKLTAYDRALDVHLSRLRQKLARAGGERELIKTVRGLGYQFVREGG